MHSYNHCLQADCFAKMAGYKQNDTSLFTCQIHAWLTCHLTQFSWLKQTRLNAKATTDFTPLSALALLANSAITMKHMQLCYYYMKQPQRKTLTALQQQPYQVSANSKSSQQRHIKSP